MVACRVGAVWAPAEVDPFDFARGRKVEEVDGAERRRRGRPETGAETDKADTLPGGWKLDRAAAAGRPD